MTRAEFPNLWDLFAGYLHQDWRIEYATVDDAIRSFVAEASPKTLEEARAELRTLLNRRFDDERLAKLLTKGLGSAYDPRVDGTSPSEWLVRVQGMLGS
jgi:hypothetical protein